MLQRRAWRARRSWRAQSPTCEIERDRDLLLKALRATGSFLVCPFLSGGLVFPFSRFAWGTPARTLPMHGCVALPHPRAPYGLALDAGGFSFYI